MNIIFVVFIAAFILVLWAGHTLPTRLNNISRVLHIPQFVVAFLLVSFATSVPELFIGLFSAFEGVPNLSLGNVMGANLTNLTFIIGFSVLLGGTARGNGKISSENFWLIFLVALLPILLAFDGMLTRPDGIVLLIAFVLYITKIFRDRQYFHRELNHDGEPAGFHTIANVVKEFSWLIVALGVLLLGTFALIETAQSIVNTYFAADFLLFGVLFMALGTALPELIFGIQSTRNGQATAMLGNALGSIPFNAAGVIGLVTLVSPISITAPQEFLVVSIFLFVAFILFHFFVYTKHRINRIEALILLLVYVGFVVVSLM